ncbi:patatin-like phospholipase family protein [Solimonas sp. K1W22B-7]|uniref:patatin-like phospholipase family protein n=1 Tax=Solimonas sp. K1W22B-7 TaxID=2303331 RepID=UPI000E32DD26|nr:patatin-like phospholipase family protein [Solimonas sp. K1W22B-7]AXQ29349.1 patatin-like phospholipase family protein [Solimonas sp. K1W22B-7]
MSDPGTKVLLKLQRMEMSAIRAVLAQPAFLLPKEYQRLRYILSFARLHRFAPGAALGRTARADVELDPAIVTPFRELVLRSLYKPLRYGETPRARLGGCMSALDALHAALLLARKALLARHAGEFSEEELHAEVSRKALVTIAGGGGGAGYVYVGAAARLRAEGRSSDYLIGSSIGALIGAFLTRSRHTDIEALMEWAKALRMRDIFSRPYIGATHSMPGITRLHLHSMHQVMSHPDGSPLRLKDLEIPYDAVVSGMRTRAYEHLPSSLRDFTSPLTSGKSFSKLLAERMLLLAAIVNPSVVKPIVLGGDAATQNLRVVDAVGLSAAIPAVLQYEPPSRDAESDAILAALRQQHDVALFVDGGVAANVPARIAWERVQEGRIGTRNAFYLALDCFHPQWEARHLWLWPVTQAVQLQLATQKPYFDWLLSFEPTLSPVNLLPSPQDFDRAFQWGWSQADVMLPFLFKALEPVEWIP